jgi:hypothetical protein
MVMDITFLSCFILSLGLVKSAYTMLRFISRACGVRTGTPHFSRFARVASEGFPIPANRLRFLSVLENLLSLADQEESPLHGEKR